MRGANERLDIVCERHPCLSGNRHSQSKYKGLIAALVQRKRQRIGIYFGMKCIAEVKDVHTSRYDKSYSKLTLFCSGGSEDEVCRGLLFRLGMSRSWPKTRSCPALEMLVTRQACLDVKACAMCHETRLLYDLCYDGREKTCLGLHTYEHRYPGSKDVRVPFLLNQRMPYTSFCTTYDWSQHKTVMLLFQAQIQGREI